MTSEQILNPGIEIVDSHHHLRAEITAAANSGHNVVQTIYVECGWGVDPAIVDPAIRPVSEVTKVAELVAQKGAPLITAIVGHADLRLGREAARTLDALSDAAGSMFVGIRHSTAWDPDPAAPVHRHRPGQSLLLDPTWRAGFAELTRRQLTFDAWVYHPQLEEVRDLAEQFPDTTIVIDHLGGPLRIGHYANRLNEVLAASRTALSHMAQRENVFLKLGGIGMVSIGQETDLALGQPSSAMLAAIWGDHIRACIDIMGASRCMFESNFPADKKTCSYSVLWNCFKRIVASASAAEQADLFAGTARRAYRIPVKIAPGNEGR